MTEQFERLLDPAQRALFRSLDSPARIQALLDSIAYSTDEFNRCPLRVLQDGLANCFDGALLAAAALRRIGHPPVIVDFLPEPGTDDEHTLAVFRQDGHWGAVAKSNFVGLRYREPIYRTLRELTLSYFESYFNVQGMKTLRSYRRSLNLAAFDRLGWMWSDAGVEAVVRRLEGRRPVALLTERMIAQLAPADERSLAAGLLGADKAGLYVPGKDGP